MSGCDRTRKSSLGHRQTASALQSGCSHCLSTIIMERIADTEAYPTSNLNRAEFPPSRRLQPSYPKEPVRQAGRETRSPQTSR